MLVDKLGNPHLKHSQFTLLSPLYTQSGIPMQSLWYHASQESQQTPGVDHFTALRQIAHGNLTGRGPGLGSGA